MNQDKDERLEVRLLTERKDEQQIIAEMKGELLGSYVYSFPQGNKTITNLSYAGVKEAIRRRGNFAIYPCDCCHKEAHVEETEEEIRAMVKVWDLKNNVQVLGASSAKKTQPFCYVLAINKAERNGFRKLLPERQISILIQEFLRQQSTGPLKAEVR